jgi:hypothetical protein
VVGWEMVAGWVAEGWVEGWAAVMEAATWVVGCWAVAEVDAVVAEPEAAAWEVAWEVGREAKVGWVVVAMGSHPHPRTGLER